ncbi:MAG: zinc-dependent metalloprotease family protein [Bacteroidales bacterium]
MKKILIIILSLFSFYCYAQEEEEYIGNYTLENIINNRQFEISFKSSSLLPLKYYKIAFHVVRSSEGTTERQGIEADINRGLAYMNEKYKGANIQFYICDIQYIDNDSLFNFNLKDQDYLLNTYNYSDAINCYLFNYMYQILEDSLGNLYNQEYWGYTYMPAYTHERTNMIALKQAKFEDLVTVAHEFGHFFGLPHTHNDYGAGNDELVNGSNCATAGDRFCDTRADPKLNFDDDVNDSCIYIGGKKDFLGFDYDPDVTLIMSYARHKCRTRFSQEQLSSLNFWANTLWRTCFSHMNIIENTTIASNQNIEEEVIILKNTKIENNAEVKLKSCAFVEISGDSEVKLGSTLDIRIE